MKIDLIAGARPNLMKVAPLLHALKRAGGFDIRFVHTGQHYDYAMSQVFFDDFDLPKPDVFLDVRGGSHAAQTARIMERYEPLCLNTPADLVIVVGDVNSTLACALTAKKCNLKLAHLEAGLRSGDRTMPEEINRIVTDAIADFLWTDTEEADDILRREGHAPHEIMRVGNIMIDAFEMSADKIGRAKKPEALSLGGRPFAVVTLHRPSNVDDAANLTALVDSLSACAKLMPLVFPVHPRTEERLVAGGLKQRLEDSGIGLIEPLGYVEFMSLVTHCALVVTDSGGIQEETTYLGVPCITVRDTTERPITLKQGTNTLCTISNLTKLFRAKAGDRKPARPVIPLWDGQTAARIVASLRRPA